MDSVQTGIFSMVLEKIWLPNASRVSGSDERKVCTVGTVDLLCRAPELMVSGPYAQHWPKLLALSLELVAGSADDGSGADDEAVEQLTELAGYTSAFCRLAYAHGRDRDPAAQVASAAKHLAQSLAALSAVAPGKV
jgi:exportin-2 (importin alpha re-exporter)